MATEQHRLHGDWTAFYKVNTKKGQVESIQDYANSVRPFATFSTVEGFWNLLDRVQMPDASTGPTEISVFKKGITPMWEDPANRVGGKWVLKVPKVLSGHYFEELLLCALGEQFNVGDEITGLVLSVRFAESVLSVWNRNSNNAEVRDKIRTCIQRFLDLPPSAVLIYKQHDSRVSKGRSTYTPGASSGSGSGGGGPNGGGMAPSGSGAAGGGGGGGGAMGMGSMQIMMPGRIGRDGIPRRGYPQQQPQTQSGNHSRAPTGRWR